jgi:subtilisin family serine protease
MKLKKRFSIQMLMVLILSMCSGLLAPSSFADPISSFHLNNKLLNESEIVPGKVIVKYKNVRYSINSVGLQSISPKMYTLTFSNEMSVTAKINELQKDPNVEYAEPVYKVHFANASTQRSVTSSIYSSPDTSYMHNWGKTVTGLTYVSSITNETNNSHVVVAVIDTGVDLNHPDLRDSIVLGYNFVNHTATALDDNGHGTNVAGIIAAKSNDGNNGTGYTGVAPLTKIMPIKVLDSLGSGDTSALVAGIRFAIDNHSNPVNIINLSLGSMLPSKAVHDVIKEAVSAGILVVAAAGNNSNHWLGSETGDVPSSLSNSNRYAIDASYPAAFDEVISVGAIEQLDNGQLTIADFSNINKVDVVAPGVNIYSTYKDGLYGPISGTSQATPFVAGFAALLKGYNPNLTVDDIRSIIRSSANGPLMPPGNQNNYDPAVNDLVTDEMLYGNGLINAKAAFELPRLVIKQVQGNLAPSRTVTFDVYAKNLLNQTLNLNEQVQIHFSVWHDESSVRSGDMTADTTTPASLNNGYVSLSFDVPCTISDRYISLLFLCRLDKSVAGGATEKVKLY